MKCALELVVTATVRAEEIAREKILREIQEREEKRTRTIQFCEQLGEKIETQANNGQFPEAVFYSDKKGHLLRSTYSDYADGRLSYREDNKAIDLELVEEWFAQYCFALNVEEFGYYRYHYGYNAGYRIKIYPKTNCVD